MPTFIWYVTAVQISKIFALALGVGLWFITQAAALTFEYTDGTKVTGDIVREDPKFLVVRTEDNKYVEIPWDKFSQTSLQELKELAAQKNNTRLRSYVEPYIEITEEERIKKTEVPINHDYEKLQRPAKGSLVGAMAQSSVGLVCLLLLYAANVYAGYEIAVIRAYPPALVCGLAAVVPVIGPIVFLCLPTKLPSQQTEAEEEQLPSAGHEAPVVDSLAHEAPAAAAGAASSAHAASTAKLPQTQVFKRGQFTFNRRFIETKFAQFFPAVRRGEDKDLVLLVKSMRGEYVATRISRIATADMHLEVHKGGASQEVQIPFVEIQEIHLKHKDA